MSADGKFVYVFMGSGEVAAFDFDGKKAWEYNTATKYGPYAIQFGAHWTPVLHKGTLYVCVMHRKAQVILANLSGKELRFMVRELLPHAFDAKQLGS